MTRLKSILRWSGNVAIGLVVAAALVFVVNTCINGLGTLPGGYRPMVVLSGSMDPDMPTGSLVLTKSVDPETVHVGDVITFRLESDSFQSDLATHRVVALEHGPGGLDFVTKGDANQARDPIAVPASAVVGRVVFVSSIAGGLVHAVKAPLFLLLLALGAALLVADAFWQRSTRSGKRGRRTLGGHSVQMVRSLRRLRAQ